jgi:hypothetical protein
MIYPYPYPPGLPIPIGDPIEEPDTGMDPINIVSPYPYYPPGLPIPIGDSLEEPEDTIVIVEPYPVPRPQIGEALEEPGSGESTGMDPSTIAIPIEAIEAPAGMEP